MGVIATLETTYAERREMYVRLNNIEQLSNHGIMAVARFRGFASKDAFEAGKPFIFEILIEFEADITKTIWKQAYAALKAHDPVTPLNEAIAKANAALADANNRANMEIPADARPDQAANLEVAKEAAAVEAQSIQEVIDDLNRQLADATQLRDDLAGATDV
jgi:hypothetical protein